jgi:hypothetical protein
MFLFFSVTKQIKYNDEIFNEIIDCFDRSLISVGTSLDLYSPADSIQTNKKSTPKQKQNCNMYYVTL